jgi:glycosyltransferase involved in cell wall biosynthesis
MKPNISLFFPVYNDEKTIERMVLKSIDVLKDITEQYEIIIINDGSPDKSGEIAENMYKLYTNINLILVSIFK